MGDKPGDKAWDMVKFHKQQMVNPTITAQEGTYQIDCEATMTRYIVSLGRVVCQMDADDLEWLRVFTPSLKPWGAFV